MTFSAEDNISRRRKEIGDSTARIIAVVSLGFLLVFTPVCLVSATEKINSTAVNSRWSPARKARFFSLASYHAARAPFSPSQIGSSSTDKKKNDDKNSSSSTDDDDKELYEEEKRLVHTGPNPLHN
ncbi:hypothetical protein BUALT_Bualt17G0109900 [Buddleja alternifolia]|uniref:CLAVATA3/ESR (CLE)-related protein n=1 Tax=Buddleja alternifolia TaxID=168488 RepID=A0AAV6W5I8_9LAMI|nr:hypothetical protein BUALT_Bualt17G0109900 [Buddleja alternifolia]